MKIFKFNKYQIQNTEESDVCSQCCATPKICYTYAPDGKGDQKCISATSKSDCSSKTFEDFDFDIPENTECDPPSFKDPPTYGGIVDESTTATCYFDKDGDGCYNYFTCQQLKKPGKKMTVCDCKKECESEKRGGQFSEDPPAGSNSPCGGQLDPSGSGKCGNCDGQEEPTIPNKPGFPPGQGGGPPPPSPPFIPPSNPGSPSPSPPNPPNGNPPWGNPPVEPNPPDGGDPGNGPATTCPDAHTLEVQSTEGFDANGGELEICNLEDPPSCFNINYEYISGNIFIGIFNNSQSILENYTVSQNGTETTSVKIGVISYDSCGLDGNGDLICCPEGWTFTNDKCCPP